MTMLDKCARALWAEQGESRHVNYDALWEADRKAVVDEVRAVLEALRDPTPEMLDASWRLTGESKEMRDRTHAHYTRHFTAMIDEALKETAHAEK